MRPQLANKAAAPHRDKSLYGTKDWYRIRAHQLRVEPNCRICAAAGVQSHATVCDHITRHNYDPIAFFRGPFQSLCKTCHDGTKQKMERRGYSDAIGSDGLPTDPNHPFNK